MGSKEKKKRSRKLIAAGGITVVILVVLLVIGITIGGGDKNGAPDSVREEAGISTMEVLEGSAGYEERDTSDKALEMSSAESPASGDSGGLIAELNKIIKTASIGVEVEKDSFDENYAKLLAVAEKYGGFVSDSQTSSTDGRITGGTVTMRVPAGSFSKAIEDCRGLGEVTSMSEQTEDVTDQYVDIESRLRNLRAQEAVYLNLMAKAQTIEESIAVQRELSALQGEIEQLTGQKNYLDNRIQYSTITVYMSEAGTEIGNGDTGWGFVQALKDAAHGVVNGLNVVIRFLGNALVYILIAALAGLGAYIYIKRRKKSGNGEENRG